MELMFAFNPKDGRHLYEQLYIYLRNEIRSGHLHPGERLPSTRQLAAALKIARTTVELAYEQLEEEGYLVIRRGSGAYVCEITNIPDLRGENSSEWLLLSDGQPAADSAADSAADKSCIDFSPRSIDMSAFPYATWRRILRGILTGDRSELFHRGDPRGDEELRSTIARYLHLSRGCHCHAGQILIGAGNDYLLMVLAMVLGGQETMAEQTVRQTESVRRIAMDEFTYLRAAEVMRGMGYTVVPVPGDHQGMDVHALEESGAELIYVMPTRQFPTGQMMPYPRRAALLSWAAGGENRYIIEDDYDSEFKYRGRPVPSLQSADENGHVIYMGTFSKAIAPAIRISYLILPERLLPVFRKRAGFLSCTVPRLDQAVLNEFIRDGYFERYLNRMRNRYKAKHDRLLELLEPLEDRFVIAGQGAGLHLILQAGSGEDQPAQAPTERAPTGKAPLGKISTGKAPTEQELVERARQRGVRVYAMAEQRLPEAREREREAKPCGKATVLLGFASLTDEEMRTGIEALKEAWDFRDGVRQTEASKSDT